MDIKPKEKPDIQFEIPKPEDQQQDNVQVEEKPKEEKKAELLKPKKEKVKKTLTKEEIDKRTFKINAISLIVLILLSLVGYWYFKGLNINGVTHDNNSSDNASSSVKLDYKEISINDPKVTQFINIFKFEESDNKNTFPSIYSSNPVISSALTLDHKLSISLHDYIRTNVGTNNYAQCSDLVTTDFSYSCDSENNVLIDNTKVFLYQLAPSDLLASYMKIFGSQDSYVDKNFETANGITCNYKSTYFCIKKDNSVAGIETVAYVTKAREYNDRMEIYTKYIWLEGEVGYSNLHHEQTYLNNYYANPAISSLKNIQDNYQDKIKETKHVFVKNNSGNYYWNSSQVVSE